MSLLPPVIATLLADTKEFSAKMDEAQAKMGETAESGSKSGGLLSSALGKGFAVVAAAAIATAVAAVDFGVKYQATTASVAASAGITTAAATSITNAFLNQAFQTTFSAQETATAYAKVAGQLGVLNGKALSTAQAMAFMTQAQELAEASGTDLATATADLSKTMQAFQVPVAQAGTATDVLFNAAKDTGTSIDSLTTSLVRARGSMGASAPPISTLGGLLLDLTQHGESGKAAVSALSSAFTGIISPSAAATKAQKEMGVSFLNSKGALLPLSQIFAELAPKLDKMSTAQAAATLKTLGFGSASSKLAETIQAGPAVLQRDTDAVQKAGSAHAAAAQQANTMEGSLKKLGSGVEDILTKLGQFFIPILADVVTNIIPVTTSIVNWVKSLHGLWEVVGTVLGDIRNIVGAVAGWISQHWNQIAADTSTAWNIFSTTIKVAWNIVTTIIKDALAIIIPVVSTAWNVISTVIGTAITVIVATVKGIVAIVSFLVGVWNTVTTDVKDFVGNVVGFFVKLPGRVVDALAGAVTWLVTIGRNIVTGLWNGITTIWNSFTNWLGQRPAAIIGFFAGAGTWLFQLGKDIINGLWNGLKAVWNSVTTWFHQLPGNILNGLKGLLGIHSPSTEMAKIGVSLMQGLAVGLQGSSNQAISAALAGASGVASALRNGLGGPLSITGSASVTGALAGAGAGAGGAAGGGSRMRPNTTSRSRVTCRPRPRRP